MILDCHVKVELQIEFWIIWTFNFVLHKSALAHRQWFFRMMLSMLSSCPALTSPSYIVLMSPPLPSHLLQMTTGTSWRVLLYPPTCFSYSLSPTISIWLLTFYQNTLYTFIMFMDKGCPMPWFQHWLPMPWLLDSTLPLFQQAEEECWYHRLERCRHCHRGQRPDELWLMLGFPSGNSSSLFFPFCPSQLTTKPLSLEVSTMKWSLHWSPQ